MINTRLIVAIAGSVLLSLGSCKKETTKDVSRVLKVPTLELIGGNFASVPVGGTYTDQGATYTGEDGSTVTVQPSENDVSTAQPGLYFVRYEQVSASGIFTTTATRIVAVGYRDNPVDYSGTYLRELTGMNAYVTRVAPGLYKVQNPGGATGGHAAVIGYFVEASLNNFIGPFQHDDTAGDLEFADIAFTNTGATWRIIGSPLYGTGPRVFVKQ